MVWVASVLFDWTSNDTDPPMYIFNFQLSRYAFTGIPNFYPNKGKLAQNYSLILPDTHFILPYNPSHPLVTHCSFEEGFKSWLYQNLFHLCESLRRPRRYGEMSRWWL